MPEVLMPRLSDTMEEGVLSLWLKSEGDEVRAGDILAEIETDKATMELEAYDEGILDRLLASEGDTVPIGQPIAMIRSPGEAPSEVAAPEAAETTAAPANATTAAADAEPPQAPVAAEAREAPAAPGAAVPAPADVGAPEAAEAAEAAPARKIRTSPLARRIASEHGIDLATVPGSGPGGRIVRADVDAAVSAAQAATAGEPAKRPEAPPAADGAPGRPRPEPVAERPPAAEGDIEEIPLNNVRRVTARRLTESAAVPHFYLTSIVDAERLLDFRAEINERLAESGTKVSVTDMLVRACALALRTHPNANSSWGGDKILRHRRVHVGVAVAVEDGLIVPVVRDADRKSLAEIAAEVRDLAERARAKKLTPDEFTGSTFSISNLGMYGIDHFTAILNPPEAALLAVGAATEEPVVRDGEIVSRRTIKLTLAIDHRVLDGAKAAEFLRDLKTILEEPLRIVV